jgi:tripartite ATP-independent transporter DctM subunit
MELYFLLLLVGLMAAALGSGYPVAFALPGSAIITIGLAAATGYLFTGNPDAYFHSGGPQQWLSAGVTNLRGVYWEVERDTLIAIPLFIFMGIMLQRSKIAEDLLVTMAQLFGPVPGGLGISVVFVGALLAATTGIVGATVVAMGLISLPAMLRNNYSPSLATGTIAASGTLGQIIPPSIVLIILADQLASATDQAGTMRKALYTESTGELTMPSAFSVTSTSAGEMFLGAFVPGILLVLLYMAYILVFAILRPKSAPAVRFEGKMNGKFWMNVALTLIPPLTLIFLVLGSIIGGIATVNQAGAIGAAGALIMAGYRLHEDGKYTFVPAIIALASLAVLSFCISTFDMNLKSASSSTDWLGIYLGVAASLMLIVSLLWSGWRIFKTNNTLNGVMLETAKTTALVFIILLGAAMLTAAFRAFGGEELVRDFLNSLPGGFWTKFIIVMGVIFILGFFLDFIEIAVVVVPIVAPILLADPSANITAVWLGVMIGLNIQTSFLTPPFGFALFYLRGVAPAIVKTVQMYKGVIAFISLQLIALLIVGLFPPLVNYLPNRVSMLGETAPPPRNPKLQSCIEEYVKGEFAANGTKFDAAHQKAMTLDMSFLPKELGTSFTKSVDMASKAKDLLAAATTAGVAIEAASDEYRVVHDQVRDIERFARDIEEKVKELNVDLGRMRNSDDEDRKKRLEDRIAKLEAEKAELESGIPATWPETFKTFSTLLKTEEDALNAYRRNSDQAYEGVLKVSNALKSSDAFLALESELSTLASEVSTSNAEEMVEKLNAFGDKFKDVDGASKIASEISKARRALDGKTVDPQKAFEAMTKAKELYAAQMVWRKDAGTVSSDVAAYESTIRDTIGIRLQEKMPRHTALSVAACNSYHEDIYLHF